MEKLIQKINIDALTSRARELRQGKSCFAPNFNYDSTKRSLVMGGMNYHIEIVFEDGVRWLARIRRFNVTSPPPELRDYIMKSEVATLKHLETTAVPAPKLFDYAFEGDGNPIGVGYMLIEKLPGTSLRWSVASSQQRTKVMEGLVKAYIELQKVPFSKMGCLTDPCSLQIGPFACESLTDFDASGMITLGPYSSIEEYYKASIRLNLDLIIRDQLYVDRPVDAYLIHRFLLDLLPKVMPDSLKKSQRFYLKHADDKGDHILVDDEYNITGIIDWEWAYTAPADFAFNSPVAFLPVSQFYEGINSLGDDENEFARILEVEGKPELAEIVRQGRVQHRFAFCCGYDLADWNGFLGLFQGLRDAVGVDSMPDWNDWKRMALERYQSDKGLQSLLKA